MKLLLHACCGPCSLEPVRLLEQAGHQIFIAFSNSNIQPRAEYDRRLDVLRTWAVEEGLPVVELPYDEQAWNAQVGALEEAGAPRTNRCRACYRLRLRVAARYAAEHGFEGLSTTLAVSPYQHSEICREELEAACAEFGLACVWRDFRPFYPEATRRSREMGMYRQNYCGCSYSKAEAEHDRAERRERKAAAAAERQLAQEQERAQRARRQAAYDEKQRKKRIARNVLRASGSVEGQAPYQSITSATDSWERKSV